MELVFLGAAERQSLAIDFTKVLSPPGMPRDVAFPLPDGTGYLKRDLVNLVPPMTVEGLLTWVWRFGSEEGPALAKAGGKLGIAEGIVDTTTKLMILVQAASFTPVSSNAFRREGVLRALRDLAMQLYQVKELAKQIIPPSTNYEPDAIDQLPQCSSGSVTIPCVLYYLYQHEQMGVFRAIKQLQNLFHAGAVRLSTGDGAYGLYRFDRRKVLRFTEKNACKLTVASSVTPPSVPFPMPNQIINFIIIRSIYQQCRRFVAR
ncbi:MAG: hypothetical protein HC784_14905 [Hydrococcus sp. CSU_1_8]|nr:hypothetical protein [Hydrococcus sp. CSU_1_8]